MKAVNLIPAEARKGGAAVSSSFQLANYALFGVLAAALVLITLYVLAGNSVSDRQAQLTELRGQVAQAETEAAGLGNYTQFQTMAHSRVQTVEGIAGTRFSWHGALADLARVVPANASLQSLTATAAPGASATGGTSGAAANLRSAVSAPAFELAGCTQTQDDVARLMSRLRLIDDVTRVTLGSSAKPVAQTGLSGTPTLSGTPQGCGADKPSFDLLVFFRPVTGAGPQGATALATTTGGSK